MTNFDQIEEAKNRIVREFDPERIVLFGSYASDQAREDSDIDLLVVTAKAPAPRYRYASVRRLLSDIPASFDIVVKTPEEYKRLRQTLNHIVYFADKYGRVLYER